MKTKLLILTAVAAALCASAAFAFDWKVQSNEELRGDMLTFAKEFALDAKGTKAAGLVSKLIKKQEKSQDPYSWIADTWETVSKLESSFGPTVSAIDPEGEESPEARIRRNTLQLLDYPAHVPEYLKDAPAAQKEAFDAFKNAYLESARKKAIAWLQSPAPAPGAIGIFKVYNMGFILRTSERTVLIDLRWDGTAEEADFIAKQADVFFLTHPHGDHFSRTMLDALQKAKVPVVLPSDLMPGYTGPEKNVVWGNDIAMTVGGVSFTTLKGNQGENVPNNVYSLEFDGWRIVDQGDNSDDELEKRLAGQRACDIVIAASWNNIRNIFSAVMAPRGANPLFIPAHENEFGHGVDHRESYHELFNRKDRLGDPEFNYPQYVLMDIGENIEVSKNGNLDDDRDPEINLGYSSVKSSQNTFSVSQVKVSERDGMVYNNMASYLQGRVAGVVVDNRGNITIRGAGSPNSSTQPLILVDGMETDSINNISPYDVEKVEVLKDAAASMYGFRGANGVILITTKRGKSK